MSPTAPAATATLTIDRIARAQQRIRGLALRTPLFSSRQLGAPGGVSLHLKAENLQRTGSFKLRGATNRLSLLAALPERPRGVITASSGNHGQAVAYAARAFGIPCTVVVPTDAPQLKINAARDFGAEIVPCGTTSTERLERAHELAEERGLVFVPPYDDYEVMAGQGTVGLEIAAQCPTADVVLVPIGGGGLISGIATAIKARMPGTRVVGVEPAGSNAHQQSRQAGRIVSLPSTDTIADGLRKLAPGAFTFPIVQRVVDDIVTVADEELLDAMARLAQVAKLVVEPSGATTVAAALQGRGIKAGETVVCVVSGGNADPAVLARALAG